MRALATIILYLGVMSGCKNIDTQIIYLIPKGYQGPLLICQARENLKDLSETDTVKIFFDDKGISTDVKYDLFRRVPVKNLKYYYIDEKRNKDEINYTLQNVVPQTLSSASNNSSDTIPLIFLHYGKVGKNYIIDLITSKDSLSLNIEKQLDYIKLLHSENSVLCY